MMKQYKAYIPVGLIILLFFALFIFRKDMVRFISQNSINQLAGVTKDTLGESLGRKYNYAENGESFDYTFLEFGSTGCHACRQMEVVMEEVRTKYRDKVKVVFVNVMNPENRQISEYFGIALIPTQVVLNKEGNEIFRHTEYISTEDLEKKFK